LKDQGKVKFIIKGRRIDQTFEYEFRDESLGMGLLMDEEPKVLKQLREASFERSEKGMYKVMHRELLMYWTSETFVLTYFYGYNEKYENV
jgi:hypothetical protein